MAETPVKHDNVGRLDLTQVHPLYRSYADFQARGDLKGLSSLYHPDALIVPNREVTQLTGSAGGGDVRAFFQASQAAGIGGETAWEYLQGTNAILVRARTNVGGAERDTFSYLTIRDGKIWRHVFGIEMNGSKGPSPAIDPDDINPLFARMNEGLDTGESGGMMSIYAENAVALISTGKSWGFRARGVAEGRAEIKALLDAYMAGSPTMVELKDYVEMDNTVYVHGLMSRQGVVSVGYGAFVIEGGDTQAAGGEVTSTYSTADLL